LAAFFGEDFLLADFGFETFFGLAGFFVAVDFGFFGVVAFFVFGFATFFVAVFFTPTALAVIVFFAVVVFAFFVPVADLGLALVLGFNVRALRTFFATAVDDNEVVTAGVVAELLVFAAVATFFAGFDPGVLERERFFVSEVDVAEAVFFVIVDFFFVGLALSFNLNEPLAPVPLVCLSALDWTPFFRANFKR